MRKFRWIDAFVILVTCILILPDGSLMKLPIAKAAADPAATITKKTLYVGDSSYTVQFKNLAAGSKVSYKSSSSSIAAVTSKGVIKPVSKGTAKITYTITQKGTSYKGTITVTVKDPYVKIHESSSGFQTGKTYTLTAKSYGLKKPSLVWTSSDTKCATIGKTSGKMTARTAGKVTITVKDTVSGKKNSITITIGAATAPTAKPTPTPTPKPTAVPTPKPVTQTPVPAESVTEGTITYVSVFKTGFEDGNSGFTRRGGETVEVSDKAAYSGSYGLLTTNRSSSWNGPSVDFSGILQAGKTYQVTARVKYSGTEPSQQIQCTIDKNSGSYIQVGSVNAVKNTWTKFDTKLIVPADMNSIKLYFEAPSNTADLYLDDVNVSEITFHTDSLMKLPSLAEVYQDYFDMGIAVTDPELYSEPNKTLILSQFGTFTMGNEMKPDALLDYQTSSADPKKYNLSPAIRTANLERYLQYAKDHGMKVRFHTLVWHSQTPRWFFTENFSRDAKAPLVTKEILLKRMENYIRQVMECTSKYPDVIYAWDVVNEAVEPNHNQKNGYRVSDSLWYQIAGEEFVEKAFEYARKYSYDDAKLYYNDYNTYETSRTNAIYQIASKLKDKGLIDGIGMQSHILMNYPSLSSYETALRKFASLGLEINVTELDMHNTQNTDAAFQQQAERYAELFKLLVKLKKEGIPITNVTFWGISDAHTWLTSLHKVTSYPLLFDGDFNPKLAFYKILEAVK